MKIKITALALCSLAIASLAQAQTFVGLQTGGLSLTTFGTNGVSSTPVAIVGLGGDDTIIDLDYRVATGVLYGMASSGTLYRIDPATGAATLDVVPASSIGTPTAIDFNPAADRLRVFSGTSNFRVTPGTGVVSSDGELTYIAGDPQFGQAPNLVAAAYVNNDINPGTGTTLYSIDATFNTLVVHPASGSPQFSMLQTQDTLTLMGVMIDFLATNTGFDVSTVGGANTAYVSSGNTIYIVNLNMGMVGGVAGDLTSFTTVTGPGAGITDFAVVAIPEPSTYALLVAGLVGLGLLQRRRAQARA